MKHDEGIRRFFRVPLRPGQVDRDVDAELEFHIQERAEKLVAEGWSLSEARLEAERRFGDLNGIEDECRQIGRQQERRHRMREMLDSVAQDVRFAFRTLRSKPGFTLFASLSLALGIGANIAVFTFLYSVLINPLPYPESDRLLFIEETSPAWGLDQMGFSYPDLVDFRQRNRTFSGMAGFWYVEHTFTGHGEPEKIMGCEISANFTQVMGVEPAMGRAPRPEEEAIGAGKVVLISGSLWQRRFGGDPDIVGGSMTLAGEPATIIGVMPEGFRFPNFSELWVPMRRDPAELRGVNFLDVVGRLKPGVTIEAAAADVERIAVELGVEYWSRENALGARVIPLREWIFGELRSPILLFYGVVCLILLLACANIANLLLARNTSREQEIAVRVAMGAARSRIIRQLLTEGLALALIGGGIGLIVGRCGRDLLAALSPVDLPPYLSFQVRPDAVGLIVGIIILSGILFGLGPAFVSSTADLRGVLQSASGRLSEGWQRNRFRSALVVFEVAIAMTVLVGASLMVKSLLRQNRIDPGFDPANLVSVLVTVPDGNYPENEMTIDLYMRLIEDVEALPGMTSAAIVYDLPTGQALRESNWYVEGTDLSESGTSPVYPATICSGGYFSTMGIPLIRGRDFNAGDRGESAPAVAIVNETFARRYWPEGDPIGKRIVPGNGPPDSTAGWYTVVGVVGDTYNNGFGRAVRPAIYMHHDREPAYDMYLVARTTLTARIAFDQLRGTIRSIDSEIPLSLFRTLDRALLETNWRIRFFSWLFGIFSLIALLLAFAGIYGVMAYTVAMRSHEFSIRMAVGAHPGRVVGMMVGQGFLLSGIGLLVGLGVSFAGMRLLSSLLFQVSPTDAGVFAVALVMMAVVTLAASYLPARRIVRLDPVEMLREE